MPPCSGGSGPCTARAWDSASNRRRTRAIRCGSSCASPSRTEASFLLHTDLRDPDAVGTELNRISLCGGRSAPQESPTDGQGPAAEFETRRRQVRHLYYSCKLAFDPRLEEHPFVGIVPSLAGRGCRFDYQELLLPFAWRTGPQEWKGAEGLQQQELLEHSPRSY